MLSFLTCRKIAVRQLVILAFHTNRRRWHAISCAKASSVPGMTHTASPRSSAAAKPRVPVPKSRVTSLSPTFAGRERTLLRLKSHITGTPLFLLEALQPHQILAHLRSRIIQNLIVRPLFGTRRGRSISEDFTLAGNRTPC